LDPLKTFMKSHTIWVLGALVASVFAGLAAESLTVTPGTRNSYDVVQAAVLKVYMAKEGEHRFVAYVVKWKGSEVIVSDPLAKSDYKVGDQISFLAQKITVENKDSASVSALVFTLGRPKDK
jgi:hypothetical protein